MTQHELVSNATYFNAMQLYGGRELLFLSDWVV